MGLHYEIIGSGPTIILIHGVCHRIHAWSPVIPYLSDRYRVVAVDLPDHGASDPLPAEGDPVEYMVEQFAELLTEVMPEGEKPHIAGNSLGGFVALELGARGLASSVTALSPAGFSGTEGEWRYTITVFRSLQKAAARMGGRSAAISRSALGRSLMMSVFCVKPWRYSAEAAAIDSVAIVESTILDRADRHAFLFSAPADEDLPITIRWGRFDMVLPVWEAKMASRVFPQAVIEHSMDGHVPMSDDPAGVAASIAACAERGLAHRPGSALAPAGG